MKILVILDHPFPPDTRVENEMKSLTAAGNEVHIACFQRTAEEPLMEQTSYGIIHRKAVSKFIYKTSVGVLKFPFYFNYWRKYVEELFSVYDFDAIHVNDLPLAKVGYEAKCKHGVHFVLDLHENWPAFLRTSVHTNTFLGKMLSSNNQWVKYEKQMCQLADRVITVVDEMQSRIVDLGIDSNKTVVVSNTLSLDQFHPVERKGFTRGQLKMLYVGGINYHRGIQYVIQALSLLKQKDVNVHFDLVGSGSYLDNIKALIKDLHVEDYVTIHGFKHYSQIANLYESAHVALIPHVKSEQNDNGLPHKIFQYLYAGIPVIISNCNSLMRIVNETQSGVSYRYDHPEELADIIVDFYAHPEKLNDYIQHGRQAVIEKYNWSVDGAKLVKLYENLS